MPLSSALHAKWQAGLSAYGRKEHEPWNGDHPLVEAHDEGLDLVNYLAESRRQGDPVLALEEQARKFLSDLRSSIDALGLEP